MSRLCLSVAALVLLSLPAQAQQMTISTPMHSIGHSFYENIGVGWGFNIRGPQGPNFQFNAPAGVPFGQGNPANNANLGFGILGGRGSAFFNLTAGQGSSSFNSSTTPSVTVMNGQQGTFSATTQRPFVISLIPVVAFGGLPDGSNIWPSHDATAPAFSSALEEKLERIKQGDTGQPRRTSGGGGGAIAAPIAPASNAPGDVIAAKLQSAKASTAGQASESVRDIQSQQDADAAAQENELNAILTQAQAAEAAGKLKIARIYYEQAARRAEGAQKLELQFKVRVLAGK